MTKQTFQATNSLIKQHTVQLLKTNPTIQYSDNSFNVKPTKMLSDCGGRGLRPDPPSPTGVNLLPAVRKRSGFVFFLNISQFLNTRKDDLILSLTKNQFRGSQQIKARQEITERIS